MMNAKDLGRKRRKEGRERERKETSVYEFLFLFVCLCHLHFFFCLCMFVYFLCVLYFPLRVCRFTPHVAFSRVNFPHVGFWSSESLAVTCWIIFLIFIFCSHICYFPCVPAQEGVLNDICSNYYLANIISYVLLCLVSHVI